MTIWNTSYSVFYVSCYGFVKKCAETTLSRPLCKQIIFNWLSRDFFLTPDRSNKSMLEDVEHNQQAIYYLGNYVIWLCPRWDFWTEVFIFINHVLDTTDETNLDLPVSVCCLFSLLKCFFCFWNSDMHCWRNVRKLDFCNFWKLQMVCAISFLYMRVGRSCGGIFCSQGRHIKKNAGNIISETELTLLQFYVSWEIIVSWAAANDYWELIVCDV